MYYYMRVSGIYYYMRLCTLYSQARFAQNSTKMYSYCNIVQIVHTVQSL
jgi:hypothetical protein